jgi:hypothetical protein
MAGRIVEEAWSGNISQNQTALSVSAYAAGRKSLLPPEYAKYKNRPIEFGAAAPSLCGKLERRAVLPRLEIER